MQCLWYASHVLYESRVTLANTIIVQLFLHLPTHKGKTRFVWVCFLCINGIYLVSRVELWGHHGIDHKVIVKPDSTDQWECIFATSQSTHSLFLWLACAIFAVDMLRFYSIVFIFVVLQNLGDVRALYISCSFTNLWHLLKQLQIWGFKRIAACPWFRGYSILPVIMYNHRSIQCLFCSVNRLISKKSKQALFLRHVTG